MSMFEKFGGRSGKKPVARRRGDRGRLVLLASVLGLLAGVYLFFHFVDLEPPEQAMGPSPEHQHISDEIANQITREVSRLTGDIDKVAADPALATLLAAADRERLRSKESEIQQQFLYAIRAKLFMPGAASINTSTSPPLSYACLDLIQRTESGERETRFETHLFGTRDEHVDIVRAVRDAGGNVAGVLLISFSVSLLQEFIDKLAISDGYFELTQGKLVMVSNNSPDLVLGVPNTAPVNGTIWRVSYWPIHDFVDATSYYKLLSVSVIALLFVIMGVYFAVRAVARRRATARAPDSGFDDQGIPERDRVAPLVGGKAPSVTPGRSPGRKVRQEGAGGTDVPAGIFRAYDIRGVVGKTLTRGIVFEIGRAIGSEAYDRGQQTVAVGRDGRISGPLLSQAIIEGLRATGRDVIDIGMVPTPVLYFATHHLNCGSGVMVTGSHNPPDYNGLKIMLDNETLAGDSIRSLYERIREGNLLSGEGSVRTVDVVDDYIHYIKEDILLIKPFRVVVDCGNGVAGVVAPRLLRELGCEVTELYCDVDGNFPNHHPDPAKPENLRELIELVRNNQADFGFAFDGDGDRLGVIASDGEIIWPDRLMMIFARDILSRHKGAEIIYDVKCTSNLGRVITEYGGKPVMYKTGHSLIKARINETGALLAGEMSGHIFIKERYFGFDDALYAAGRLLEAIVLIAEDRSTGEVFAALPDAVNTPELNVQMQEGENFEFMDRMLETASFEDGDIITIDGLRVDFDDGWGLVRASNTTPSLVLRFEGRDPAALMRIQEQFREQMKKINPDIELPF